jgi:hypothetical protein
MIYLTTESAEGAEREDRDEYRMMQSDLISLLKNTSREVLTTVVPKRLDCGVNTLI